MGDMQCENCHGQIAGSGKRFCSRSCAAAVNGRLHPKRRKKEKKPCLTCQLPVKSNRAKFCSRDCAWASYVKERVVVEAKVCLKCLKEKDAAEFSAHNTRDGLQTRCKSCRSAHYTDKYKQQKRILGPEAARQVRSSRMRKAYGISIEVFDEIVASQDGKCAICSKVPPVLVVDHCHLTGQVRGALCHRCNLGIGHLNDDLVLLRRAVSYLENYAPLV